jgi:hypothetical protein
MGGGAQVPSRVLVAPDRCMHCRDVAGVLQQEGSWPLTAKGGAGGACGLSDGQPTTASNDPDQ